MGTITQTVPTVPACFSEFLNDLNNHIAMITNWSIDVEENERKTVVFVLVDLSEVIACRSASFTVFPVTVKVD